MLKILCSMKMMEKSLSQTNSDVLEPACTSSLDIIVKFSGILWTDWRYIGSLKLAMMRIFSPCKSVNNTNQPSPISPKPIAKHHCLWTRNLGKNCLIVHKHIWIEISFYYLFPLILFFFHFLLSVGLIVFYSPFFLLLV